MSIQPLISHDNPEACRPWLDRLLNAVLVFVLLHALVSWFSHRFLIGHDAQTTLCLSGNHRWYLIDKAEKSPELGDLVAYRSDARMAPELPLGTLVVKRVEALGGDRVDLETQGIRIQGELRPVRFPHRQRLKDRALSDHEGMVIPDTSLWVMGDHPRSFDSRYFGPVSAQQIIGVARALPF